MLDVRHDNAVHIHHGYHHMSTAAWIRQRTSDRLDGLTAAPRVFTRHPVFDQPHLRIDIVDRMQPYAECRHCLAFDRGDRGGLYPCDSRCTIDCPTCDQRCRLELTAVASFSVAGGR